MVSITQRTSMALYSDPNSAQCHRVRIVLGEKDLIFNVEDILIGQNNEDLLALNPCSSFSPEPLQTSQPSPPHSSHSPSSEPEE